MAILASVAARTIYDSRRQPTVEVTLAADSGEVATASLPLGSSLGRYEAPLVASDEAVKIIEATIAPAVLRRPVESAVIDAILHQIYTDALARGTNSTLGVSLAAARLEARLKSQPLYRWLQAVSGSPGYSLPTPMFNHINGGVHAKNNLDFQEYLVIPLAMTSFHEKLAAGRAIFSTLSRLLIEGGHDTTIGYEGGFAPNLATNEEGLGLLVEAVRRAGFTPGTDVWLGLDVAAASLDATLQPSVAAYTALFDDFPLLSIEDPFVEDDWDEWQALKMSLEKLNETNQPRLIVGDDLFVGNRERLESGIRRFSANAILIKLCQAPTLTGILDVIRLARDNNYVPIISHRSGDTLDSFIADLAVGTAATFLKAGAPNDSAPERMVKYERLVQIEEELHAVS